MFTVTADWIKACCSVRGGYTRDQLAAVGVSWPPQKGWPRLLVGRQLTEEQRQQFESESLINGAEHGRKT